MKSDFEHSTLTKRSSKETQEETSSEIEYQKKLTELEEIKKWADNVRDRLGMPIDEGIKDTVIFLNAFGINTVASCEGHLDRGTGASYIDIESKEVSELEKQLEQVKRNKREREKIIREIERKNLEERQKIMDLLDEFYKNRIVPYDRRLVIQSMERYVSRLQSQGANLQGIRTEDIKKEKLLEYHKEMEDFTKFLRDKYFSK